jgi:predicted nucleotidyltransferase
MNIIEQVYSNINNDITWIKDRTCFLTIYGSTAYGLNTPESDIDVRGITTVPKQYLFGFNKHFYQLEKKEPDTTIFDIKKFFSLTSVGNPNTLEMLFVEPEHHLIVNDIGQILIDNRDYFLSKQLKERYIGYAKAQAHRIRNHRGWLLNPIDKKPERKDYNLPDKPQIEKNQFDAVKSIIQSKIDSWTPDFEPFSESQKIYLQGKVSDILTEMNILSDDKWCAAARSIGFDDNLIDIIKKEKEFENKVQDYKNFQEWKKKRNPKRAALEAAIGYDSKHMSTLIRLLKVGKEILDTGKVQVKRTYDREELMEIKNCKWPYQKAIDLADKIEAEVKVSYLNSKLPNQPNINYLDNLCIQLSERNL